MTLVVCTLILGVGSEFLQSFLPNDRDFDIYDIVANLVGSLSGVALCSWYHKRMLERRRQQKSYTAVPGEDEGDIELGEGHETGIAEGPPRSRSLEQEVDNWDENAPDDWEEDDVTAAAAAPAGGSSKDTVDPPESADTKKRAD